MAANPPTPPVLPPDPARSPTSVSPVAVVWCRQVDNEAESPGYTTVPEDFPGQHETLETIRAVGHLTVNVADTHDYWDPDPSQPLSYYPNLFLYPAGNGRYTCLGRMFLSTEDRPRLGMKTLVLDTAQLLASGDFGGTILRWHASMGGPRRDGGRAPPIPNPALYNLLGEGFLFHRGSTDPVVMIAADDWEPAMQTLLELVRVLPASLVALGAFLAFPYFLPQPKTNLTEFAEQLPLALALMRIPRGEAAGDRHTKRMASWDSATVTLRDLTEGIPSAPKGRENVPLVLQYARDHQDAKLAPISQRVDLVEAPRLRAHLTDPERQGGRDRRKEMWRIGTAMESAALLLQRARGRHVPVNAETAKRAQEYIQARLPEPDAESSAPEAAVIGSPGPVPTGSTPQVPPWLSRSTEAPAPARAPSVPEVVPVSHSDDPSLLPPVAPSVRPLSPVGPPTSTAPAAAPPSPSPPVAARPSPPVPPLVAPIPALAPPAAASGTPTPPPTVPPPAVPFPAARPVTPAPVPSPLPPAVSMVPTPARLAASISSAAAPPAPSPIDPAALRRELQGEMTRWLELRLSAPVPPAAALDDKLRAELDARTGARVDAAQREASAQLAAAVAAVEAHQAELRRAELAQLEARIAESGRKETDAALARRLESDIAPRLNDLDARTQAANARHGTLQAETSEALGAAVAAAEARSAEARARDSQALEARLQAALEATLAAEVDQQLGERFEPRIGELTRRIDDAVRTASAGSRDETRTTVTQAVESLQAQVSRAEEELRANLLSQLDLQLRESEEREAQSRAGLDSRLDSAWKAQAAELEARRVRDHKDLEQRLNLLVDGRSRESQDRLAASIAQSDARFGPGLDQKITDLEGRLTTRLDGQLNDATEARVQAMADLQVRLQAYFDQRVREEQERERQKYLELLARMKGEVDSSLSRMVDSARFDTALREKIGRTLEVYRAETQRAIESRIATAEQQLKVDQTDVSAHLARLEQLLEERRSDLTKLDETMRQEMEDLDRRSQILADRLVPVVRKTWLRVVELQKGSGPGDAEGQVNQVRREFHRELQRVEGELVERTTEIRDRMESAISNQGRVWLTLIRQLSQLSDDRRTLERKAPGLPGRHREDDAAIVASLEGIPGAFPPAPSEEDDPVNPLDPDPSEPTEAPASVAPASASASGRRRFRRTAR